MIEIDYNLVRCAEQIGAWFKEHNITEWALGPCASREWCERLEAELKLNTSMLAKQCDLAREAESENQRILKTIEQHRNKPLVFENDAISGRIIEQIYKRDKELYTILDKGV